MSECVRVGVRVRECVCVKANHAVWYLMQPSWLYNSSINIFQLIANGFRNVSLSLLTVQRGQRSVSR